MDKETYIKYLKDYLHLISLYLNKKEEPSFKIDESNFNIFLNLSKMHSLTALFYKVVKDTKVDIKEEHLKVLEQYYLSNVQKHILFERERKALFDYFYLNGIVYLQLKGLVLKDYYPDPYTREFADNDIYFRGDDEIVKKFFVDRGYKVEIFRKSNHDVYLKKPCLNFEMHRALFGETGDNDKFIEYFATPKAGPLDHECREDVYKPNNFYVYFTAHTYKHFHIAGCGLRTLVDYYIFLKRNQENETLDFKYIKKELNKIDLVDFSNQISTLSLKVFDEKELSNEELETLLFIASSGTYGTLENRVNKGVKEKGKTRYFFSRIFPPYRFYKSAYPWAYKVPILIPIAWLCRFFRVLFKSPKRATNELKMISKTKEEKKD